MHRGPQDAPSQKLDLHSDVLEQDVLASDTSSNPDEMLLDDIMDPLAEVLASKGPTNSNTDEMLPQEIMGPIPELPAPSAVPGATEHQYLWMTRTNRVATCHRCRSNIEKGAFRMERLPKHLLARP